jgi:hypothetical protein
MIYKALKNFRIDKFVVSAGDTYTGSAIDLLLSKGLIKLEESTEDQYTDEAETLETPPAPKKKKKKE